MSLFFKIFVSLYLISFGLASFKLYVNRDRENCWGEFFRTFSYVRESKIWRSLFYRIIIKDSDQDGGWNREFECLVLYMGWCWLVAGCYGIFGGCWYVLFG